MWNILFKCETIEIEKKLKAWMDTFASENFVLNPKLFSR
jgi:hypothetical protein